MNKPLSVLLSSLLLIYSDGLFADTDKFLGPRDRRELQSAIDDYIKRNDSVFQYGNWYSADWWNGAKQDHDTINKLPIDSLDAIAQKHSFAYQVAEQQGKIYGITEEKRLKAIANYFAVREAKALAENPKHWLLPASDINKAVRYRDRMMTGFDHESANTENVTVINKALDWSISPIETWQLDRTHQLTVAALEKQITALQIDWNVKQFLALTQANKIPDSNDEHANTEPTLKNDPDYITLMNAIKTLTELANKQANSDKTSKSDTLKQIKSLEQQIAELSKRIEAKCAKKTNIDLKPEHK